MLEFYLINASGRKINNCKTNVMQADMCRFAEKKNYFIHLLCIHTNLQLHHHIVEAIVAAASHKATHVVLTWREKRGRDSFRLL